MHKIYLFGSEYHCKMVRGILSSDNEVKFVESIQEADLIYVIYGPGVNRKTLKYWIFTRKPFLIHWIGTDTFILDKSRSRPQLITKIHRVVSLSLMKFRNLNNSLKFLSSAPWLAKDVAEMTGIDTEYFVLTSIENENLLIPNQNRTFDFITYIPLQNFEMYFGSVFLEIVKLNPDKQFCIVCPDLLDIKNWPYERYTNLKIQQRTNKEGFYQLLNQSKCFIRLKDGGDAIALSVLEALAHGCKVVWNIPFDYCNFETRDSFKLNYKKYFGEFELNREAIRFVKENYNVDMWRVQFKSIINELLKSKKIE
ncbi:hypothetical protein [Cohnella massiliensis]|uniref:hypothetical protein n=1 Tax=Cohnella massiliensis TaxID=1816691 RepID=UPI0009BB62D1|nr:hypothetical protein [Cohnella massiliensis]